MVAAHLEPLGSVDEETQLVTARLGARSIPELQESGLGYVDRSAGEALLVVAERAAGDGLIAPVRLIRRAPARVSPCLEHRRQAALHVEGREREVTARAAVADLEALATRQAFTAR